MPGHSRCTQLRLTAPFRYPAGWVQETEVGKDDASQAHQCLDLDGQQQEAAAKEQVAGEPHDQSCTATAAAAPPEQEGGCYFWKAIPPPTVWKRHRVP